MDRFENAELVCRDPPGAARDITMAVMMTTRRIPLQLLAALVLGGSMVAAQAPQSLPYAAVHNPEFIPASAATFMNADDRLIGVMSGTVAKAFPAGILAQHGLVQDESPDGPIAVTW
jgi:hypothetical protein